MGETVYEARIALLFAIPPKVIAVDSRHSTATISPHLVYSYVDKNSLESLTKMLPKN